MTAQPELDDNRLDRRHETAATLVFSAFSSRRVPSFPGRVCNFSQRGLSFQSPWALTPGQYIHLRLLADPDGNHPGATATGIPKWQALAQVRWCRALDPSSGSREYAIGIQYL